MLELNPILWLILGFFGLGLILSYINPSGKAHLIFSVAWLFFAAYWAYLPTYYLEVQDYFNVLLVSFAAILSISIGLLELWPSKRKKIIPELTFLGRATAVACLIYFPFFIWAELVGSTVLQATVASHTSYILELFGLPVESVSNTVFYFGEGNTAMINIILACTGLGSVAMFLGVILPSKNDLNRKMISSILIVSVIYILNLIRNSFVVYATGVDMFEGISILGFTGSFNIAHNLLSKIGSIIALFLLAFLLFKILPNLLDTFEELVTIPDKLTGHGRG